MNADNDLTPEEIAELKRLEAAATKGEWRPGFWSGQCHKPEHHGKHPGRTGDNPCVYDPYIYDSLLFGICSTTGVDVIGTRYEDLLLSEEDGRFIIAARNALPRLIATVERLQDDLAKRSADWDKPTDGKNRTTRDWFNAGWNDGFASGKASGKSSAEENEYLHNELADLRRQLAEKDARIGQLSEAIEDAEQTFLIMGALGPRDRMLKVLKGA